MKKKTEQILNFDNLKVLVVGDVMLDRYLIGRVDRKSPEADVPVLLQRDLENRLGGSGNVALNIKSLGADVGLCTVIGNDRAGSEILSMLDRSGINKQLVFTVEDRITTSKSRFLNGDQHLLRLDREDSHDIKKEVSNEFLENIKSFHESHHLDLIILQDYNKGFLTPWFIESLINYSRLNNIMISVDPKKKNFFAYEGADLFKPNWKELCVAYNLKDNFNLRTIKGLSEKLFTKLKPKHLMVTLSEHGLYYMNDLDQGILSVPSIEKPDVCGAGDSIISLASLLLLKGMSLREVAIISNLAGAQICRSPGVVPINRKELREDFREMNATKISIRSRRVSTNIMTTK